MLKIGSASLIALGALLIVPASYSQVLYSNGPEFGTSASGGTGEGWTINGGYVVSDSFTLAVPGTANGFDFTTWNIPGDDTLNSVTWALGTSVYGSDVDSGTASVGTNLSSSFLAANAYGYDIDVNTVTGLTDPLSAGTTYWLTLSDATVDTGDPVYWDENDGPSMAFENANGSLAEPGGGNNGYCANGASSCTGSETFDIAGTGTPEPGTLGLIGCGLLAMAGMIRRKTCRV